MLHFPFLRYVNISVAISYVLCSSEATTLYIFCFGFRQVLIWIVIPSLRGSTMANTRNVLRFIIIFQYLPRLFLIFPLSAQIVKATGVVTETAWAGAAYNLMLYMLASHVSTPIPFHSFSIHILSMLHGVHCFVV